MNDDYQNSDNLNSDDTGTSGKGKGFAGMSKKKREDIARKGGRAAHRKGTAHEWDSSEAKKAGQKGGRSRNDNENYDE